MSKTRWTIFETHQICIYLVTGDIGWEFEIILYDPDSQQRALIRYQVDYILNVLRRCKRELDNLDEWRNRQTPGT